MNNTKDITTHFFGIDFGTTNCAVYGFIRNGDTIVSIHYADNTGKPFPSLVAINNTDGTVYTGREAWEKKNELNETCTIFSSIKTVIDKDESYVIAGKEWTPTMIATELFKMLKADVNNRDGSVLDSAIVAIPVGMSAKKRAKIRDAADEAGIKIKNFISEPTAAYLANYRNLSTASNIAVFDWGGGTLDCSVIRHEKGKIYELATAGIYLAGDDIDRKLSERIHDKVAKAKGIPLSFDDMPASAKDKMILKCEQAKIKFADMDDTNITLLNYGKLGNVILPLNYDWFYEVIRPEVEKAIELFIETINQSGVGEQNIDAILLVGGSSNLRPLIEEMEKRFGNRIYSPAEKMLSVARGAAILSAVPGNYISNQSIGLKISDGSYFELLPQKAKLRNWSVRNSFGIVDTRKEARFIFSGSPDIDKSSEKYKVLEIPTYQFLNETIDLIAFVDRDLVFTVVAGSSFKPKSYRRVWQYLKLKTYYKFPNTDIFNM